MLFVGRCQFADWEPTEADAEYRQCTRLGVLHRERDALSHYQQRYLCPEHGDRFNIVRGPTR
jgi:hypothetical protein